jgi:murein L,D-transpeptidase YcbB/YkuD
VLLVMLAAPDPLRAALYSSPPPSQAIADELRHRLEAAELPLRLEIAGEPVLASHALPGFYDQRVYRPAWSEGGAPGIRARELLAAIEAAGREGLQPESYHLEALRLLSARLETVTDDQRPGLLAELDLLLTDAFLIYAAHLVSGRVDPTTLDPEWIAVRREVDLVATLEAALDTGRVGAALEALLPDHEGYFRLREAADRYLELERTGGWEAVSDGSTLRPGDRGSRVVELRRRLAVTGDLAPEPGSPPIELFDQPLAEALRRFQIRNGLDGDGVVGAMTLAALNVPVEMRRRQLLLNLERWRWLPQNLGERYVLVNLPAFDLQVVEGTQVTLEMKVAIGRRYRRTPVFSDTIRYLVFNPYWEIPLSIAVRDKLPEIRKDPEYLEKQGIRVFSGWGIDQQELDPATIDWSSLGPGRFPYRLRQDPGPLNALGRVKFMFPNRFNVYLHDTPTREVFLRSERDVSSGCVRVEKPLELAEYLLRDAPEWDRQRMLQVTGTNRELMVPLPESIPVHILHWTAWVNERGEIEFRADLYGRDAKLADALGAPYPGAP